MVKLNKKTVDEILSNLEPGRKEITEKFRSMVKKTIPDAAEIVRRGRITYILNGKDFLSIRTPSLILKCSLYVEQHVTRVF